jgi:hypothetical protein
MMFEPGIATNSAISPNTNTTQNAIITVRSITDRSLRVVYPKLPISPTNSAVAPAAW